MSAPPFAYARAASLDDALARLAEPGAVPLAGGQGLLPRLHRRELAPSTLVDVGRLDELARLQWTGDGALRCGGAVTLRRMEGDPLLRERLPGLVAALGTVGTAAIRNRATLGGSLAQGDPGAVPAAMLAVAGARAEIASGRGRRRVPAAAVAGSLQPGELLVAIEVPAPPEHSADAWAETATRPGDRAELGAAVRVALGAGAACAVAGLSRRPVLAAAGSLSGTPGSDSEHSGTLARVLREGAESMAAALAATVTGRDEDPGRAGPDLRGVLAALLRRALLDAGAPA